LRHEAHKDGLATKVTKATKDESRSTAAEGGLQRRETAAESRSQPHGGFRARLRVAAGGLLRRPRRTALVILVCFVAESSSCA
jgi:hypothetical protein